MAGTSRTLSYLYDSDGNRTRITHPDGAAFGYLHDPLGRMTHHYEISAAPGIDDHVVRYWYKPSGERHAVVRGAGTIGFYTVHYYDAAMRPSVLANDLPVAGADLSIEYGWNPAGQIVALWRSNDAYAFAGTTPSRSYTADGLNRYTSVGGVAHGYDANGNLTSDGTTTYTYDVENRLVAASGAKNAALAYDPLGRLFQTSGGAAGVTQFLYDGDGLAAEYNASGTLLRRYVHGPGADDPVAVYDGPALGLANRRYMLPDHQGSIVALVNADGSPSLVNSYDEYGIPGAANQGRFQYTGQAWISELGLYHYKARVYSPMLGRFLQTDPIGYEDQVNLYAYVRNDPINLADSQGTDVEVRLMGFPLRDKQGQTITAPFVGPLGHTFVRYRDTTTGEARIARGGPERDYNLGASSAATNQGNGQDIQALDTPEKSSRDYGVVGTVTLQVATIPGSVSDVQRTVGKINERINEADVPYLPVTNNSNTYAGSLFKRLTNTEPQNKSGISFPGLNSKLKKSTFPPCIPVKDTTGCGSN